MADEKMTWPSSTPTAVSDYQAQNNILAKLAIGFNELSITNYNNTSLPAVAAGSIVEVAGSLYTFATETAISGTCTDTSTNYIYLVPSGSNLTPTWTTTAPTWDSAKQGWYGTGGAATYRYIASLYRDGTAYIGKTMLTAPAFPKAGAASLIVAASDSSARSKAMADYTCDGTADDVEIQAAIDYLNALGSGEVALMEGTYNITTMITVKDSVNVRGCGAILKRAAAITGVISPGSNDHIEFINLMVDGNKATYTGSNYVGFTGSSAGDDVSYIGCRSYNNDDDGFGACESLIGCVAHDNGRYGFASCNFLSVCKTYDNGTGFYGCEYVSTCEATSETSYGFYSCKALSACRGVNTGASGFYDCYNVVNCVSTGNTSYGFDACTQMSQNATATNSAGSYNASYADVSSNAAANTAAGGYNH